MVSPIVPQREASYSLVDVVDILHGQLVPVQSVDVQDEQAGLLGVGGVVSGLHDGGDYLLIALRHAVPFLQGVDVHFESELFAFGEIKAGFHPAPAVLVDVGPGLAFGFRGALMGSPIVLEFMERSVALQGMPVYPQGPRSHLLALPPRHVVQEPDLGPSKVEHQEPGGTES
ncbi:UNVERIFIED_CONTAM: hypothetical protein FKN15_063165 [Acipenser sinensis]